MTQFNSQPRLGWTNGRPYSTYPKGHPQQGKREYFKPRDAEEAARLHAQWWAQIVLQATGGEVPTDTLPQSAAAGIREIVDLYLSAIEMEYSRNEHKNHRLDLHKLCNHLGDAYPIDAVTDLTLEDFRTAQVKEGRTVGVINKRTNRIRQFYRWAAKRGHVGREVSSLLAEIKPLKVNKKSRVAPVRHMGAVSWEDAKQLFPFVSPTIRAMITVQFWGGMRADEVCRLTPNQLRVDGTTWTYIPDEHKTDSHGRPLVKILPEPARMALVPYLEHVTGDEFIFTPKRSWTEWTCERGRKPERKCPKYPSEIIREEKRKEKRKRQPLRRHFNDRYTSDTYGQAIKFGHARAKRWGETIPHWTSHQLRGGMATLVDKHLGADAARAWLGHSDVAVTEGYIHRETETLVQHLADLEEKLAELV